MSILKQDKNTLFTAVLYKKLHMCYSTSQGRREPTGKGLSLFMVRNGTHPFSANLFTPSTILTYGVIGNTLVFGASFLGSSPSRSATLLVLGSTNQLQNIHKSNTGSVHLAGCSLAWAKAPVLGTGDRRFKSCHPD